MRQLPDDEERKDLIVALEDWFRRARLIVREQHRADQQKQRELKQHDEATKDDRLLTVTLITASEQSLHQQLIGAVRSHRQKSSAQQSGPKCKRNSEIEFERKQLKLAGGPGGRRDGGPVDRNQVQ